MILDYETRGYEVLENGPIYFTMNIDRTIEWFEKVLGWYGTVDARDAEGNAIFAGIVPVPKAITEERGLTYIGYSLFVGEPSDRIVGYVIVNDLDRVHKLVVQSDWTEFTDIISQPWGGKEFSVTTVDGSMIRIASFS